VSTNIAKAAFSAPISFNNHIVTKYGAFTSIKIKEDHLILTCRDKPQKLAVKQETELFGHTVTVRDPSHPHKSANQDLEPREKLNKGIIFKVPLEIEENDIIEETGSIKVYRLNAYKDGSRQSTETVVISFIEEIPDTVHISFLRFRVKQFIPHPFRCTNCQMFGHASQVCYRKQR